jgi:Tol biopolymer transport system component/DNA-binding winged helix-turn-helix (wHTH) protein
VSRPIRFASFELDPAAGELRKSGVRVPLSGQPLDVLAVLLSRPGEVVSRDDLKQALWPDDTFVDFDNGVNSAIRRIRRALDDSATEPRFIETLPKRGYRFIGAVEEEPSEDSFPNAAPPPPGRPRWRSLTPLTLGGIAVALILLWLVGRPNAPKARPAENLFPLTSLPGVEQHPTFSPDGAQVAFSWNGGQNGDFDIYAQSVEGGDPRPVVTDPADDITPAWSPDGAWIAFWRSGEHESGIYVVRPGGGGEKRLLTFEVSQPIGSGILSRPYNLSWSADGKWIAFTDFRTRPWRISAISLDGDERSLTSPDDGALDLSPAFSPDGSRLAWKRWFGELTEAFFTMRLSDRQPVQASERMRDLGRFIAWTPDSRELIFDGRGYAGLRALRLSDGVVRAIPNATPAAQPAISINRRRLAFARRVGNLDVLRVDILEGSLEPASTRLSFPSTQSEFAPQISPDGLRILQTSYRTGPLQLWTAALDGSGGVPLAPGGSAGRWSPDGKRIAFDRAFPDDAGFGVWVIDAEGGIPEPLTGPSEFASQPCWSEEGTSVYFNYRVDGKSQIWGASASGAGELRRIAASGQRCWASAGFVYFTRGADLWRIPENGKGDEELVLEQRLYEGSGHWQVIGDRLYFIDFEQGRREGVWKLKRLDLSTTEVVEMLNLPREPSSVNGLALSPDETWLLYTVDNQDQQDIYAIEGFDLEGDQ